MNAHLISSNPDTSEDSDTSVDFSRFEQALLFSRSPATEPLRLSSFDREEVRVRFEQCITELATHGRKLAPEVLEHRWYHGYADAAPSQLVQFILRHAEIDRGSLPAQSERFLLTPDLCMGVLSDEVRTRRFLEAVRQEVQKRLSSEPNRELCVVDAGCGPLPILGMLAALQSERVKVTCLEINNRSAAIAEQVIRSFNLQDRVSVLCGDALQYQPERPIDLLVSETMAPALTNEPIVSVTGQLAHFLHRGGACIPSSVELQIGFGRIGSDPEETISVGDVMFSHYPRLRWLSDPPFVVTLGRFQGPIDFSGAIPDDLAVGVNYDLFIGTKVNVAPEISLGGEESAICETIRVYQQSLVLPNSVRTPLRCLLPRDGGSVVRVSYEAGSSVPIGALEDTAG